MLALTCPVAPSSAGEGDTAVWQIGVPDHDYRDLAFSGDLDAYAADFPDDVDFAVGRDDASKVFSALHPGARDKWAGRQTHVFRIRFGLGHEPAGLYLLRIDLVDTHNTWPPQYRVVVNGVSVDRELPRGTGDASLLQPARGGWQQLRFVIRGDLLDRDANTIELSIVRGSWLLYDALSLRRLSPENLPPITMTAAPSVFFVERAGGLEQESTVSADGLLPAATARLQVDADGTPVDRFMLEASAFGTIDSAVHLPPVTRPRELTFKLTADDRSAKCRAPQRPHKKWRIYVAPAVHVDIGYTHPQHEIAEIHNRNTTYARELADTFDGFRFNQECVWPIRNWLDAHEADRCGELYDALRSRRLGMSCLYLNLLTGLCTEEELIRNLYAAARLNREQGVPITTAMLTDAPSHVASLPSILAGAGVRYLSVGVNDIRAPLFKQNLHHKNPFWWQGPDGQRVLTWFAVGYGFRQASRLGIRPEIARLRTCIEQELQWWEQREDYPYDAIYFHGVYGDNQPIRRDLAAKVAEYNRRYAYPKVILCLPETFFRYVEAHFADAIPTVGGGGGSWWEDGAASTAYETGVNRVTHHDIIAAETVWTAALRPDERDQYPQDAFDDAWRNVLLYDEHTWGAHNSIAKPTSDFVTRQWAVKAGYARQARDLTAHLLRCGLQRLAARVDAPAGSLLVFNPSGRPRTDVVYAQIPRHAGVLDGRTVLPFQVVEQGELGERTVAFLARDVPAVGYRTYQLQPAPYDVIAPDRFAADTLENAFYRITFDRQTGAVASLIDKRRTAELVDASGPYRFGQLVYATGGAAPAQSKWQVPDPELIRRAASVGRGLELGSAGPIYTTVVSRLELPGFRSAALEVRLYEHAPRIDFVYHLDKEMTFEKEALYAAFPVAGANPHFRYEIGGSSVAPNVDHLAGACLDWFAVQRWVTVNTDDAAVAWVPVDTPLITLCDMTPGKWLETLPITNGTIFAYAMNNYWCTNYKAGQDGRFTLRFSLTSEGSINPAAASRFGESVVSPLRAVRVPGYDGADLGPGHGFCRVEPESVELTAVKPADDGRGLIVRVRETAGRDTDVRITATFGRIARATRCDLVERPLGALSVNDSFVTLNVGAHAMATVRLE